jgi:hypothetical protein
MIGFVTAYAREVASGMDWNQLLDRVESVREVQIETAPSADAPSRRTTIWPAPQDGELYVRSLRGMDGRWFRDLVGNTEALLHVGDDAVPVRPEPATDRDSVAKADESFRRRYADSPNLEAMTRPEIIDTTLRLVPR